MIISRGRTAHLVQFTILICVAAGYHHICQNPFRTHPCTTTLGQSLESGYSSLQQKANSPPRRTGKHQLWKGIAFGPSAKCSLRLKCCSSSTSTAGRPFAARGGIRAISVLSSCLSILLPIQLQLTIPILRQQSLNEHTSSSSNIMVAASGVGISSTTSGARAADAPYTDRNRLAAETWRAVDESYLDRTFNGNDWFKLRQQVVKRDYKSDEEVYEQLKMMLSKLGDKYTRYLTPAQYSALLNSATGELIGIGVELLSNADDSASSAKTRETKGKEEAQFNAVVARLEDGSPAASMGVQREDVIINVDGSTTAGLSPEEVAAMIRGKAGTKATIRVRRPTSPGSDQFTVLDLEAIRQPIKLKGVSFGQFSAPNSNKKVGFLSLRSFASNTREDVTRAMEELHRKNYNDPLDALVIDLRNNGGGLLQGAVETSNLFLRPGKIVVFVVNKESSTSAAGGARAGNTEAQQTLPNGVISTDPDLPDLRTPMYILINGNTASAAEVFAAAMKENGRATLVGEKSFGKGIIQNLQQLRQGGVAITIARYETPKHNNINKVGISADIPLSCEVTEPTESCAKKITF